MSFELAEIMAIPAEKLGEGSTIRVELVDTEDDLYHDMANEMAALVRANNAAGKPTTMIVPVGPVGQYARLARRCNRERLSLRDVVFINMDEYLTDRREWIAADHVLSFRGFMQREFYDRLDAELRPPAENRVFPDPTDPEAVPRRIEARGGVDLCQAGIGIVGHLAFNEPPEPDEEVDADAFRNRPTRVLRLTRETRTINSVTAGKGWIEGVPEWAITVGMKEILGSRRLHLFCNREWQPAVVRKTLYGPITPRWPASFCQTHPDCALTMTDLVAQSPVGRLR